MRKKAHRISLQQIAAILLLQSSNVMRKSVHIHIFIERSSSMPLQFISTKGHLHQSLQVSPMYFTLGSFLAFLKLVESVKKASSVFCIVAMFLSHNYYFTTVCIIQCIYNTIKFTKCLLAVILQWIYTHQLCRDQT